MLSKPDIEPTYFPKNIPEGIKDIFFPDQPSVSEDFEKELENMSFRNDFNYNKEIYDSLIEIENHLNNSFEPQEKEKEETVHPLKIEENAITEKQFLQKKTKLSEKSTETGEETSRTKPKSSSVVERIFKTKVNKIRVKREEIRKSFETKLITYLTDMIIEGDASLKKKKKPIKHFFNEKYKFINDELKKEVLLKTVGETLLEFLNEENTQLSIKNEDYLTLVLLSRQSSEKESKILNSTFYSLIYSFCCDKTALEALKKDSVFLRDNEMFGKIGNFEYKLLELEPNGEIPGYLRFFTKENSVQFKCAKKK